MVNEIDFAKSQGLVPAIIQDVATSKVLMLGFMNSEALEKTRKEGRVTFYSRSKKRLWTKGETSGNFLNVEEIIVDCDKDTILIKAKPLGPACHSGADTCFGEVNQRGSAFLGQLDKLVAERKARPQSGSYTTGLFESGINRIAQKVGEEAVELLIASKDSDKGRVKEEAADLIFHFLVLLREQGLSIDDVIEILKERHEVKLSK